MLRRYLHFFAYLLLVLMPLQALASANMLVCNNIMQAQAVQEVMEAVATQQMPCHQHMDSSVKPLKNQDSHQSSCKAQCAKVCANLSALSILTNNIKSNFQPETAQVFDINNQNYTSVNLPSLQRPPIAFI
jgi:hypothetical protein